MTKARMNLITLGWLVPATALAHGPGGHPADPDLHVDPTLEDCSVQFAPELTQDAFRRFAREFGTVSAFKLSSPPTTLGRWRVSLGIEQFYFSVDEKADAWNDTFAHPDAYHELGSDLDFPRLRLRVGVSDRIDLGAYYTRNPQANYGWLGLDLKYGMLRQSETMPISLAVRGAYTKTLYVEDMNMHAVTADVAAGRTFWNVFTPYVGVGSDLVWVRETSSVVDLQDETQVVPQVLGGFELRVWHVGFGVEAHHTALTSWQMQLSALF